MGNRIKYIEGEIIISLEEIELRLEKPRNKFQELIEIGQEVREKEILDYQFNKIANNTP